MSNIRQITFTLRCDEPARFRCRNKKKTNWLKYDTEHSSQIGMWIGQVRTPVDVEREITAINSLTQLYYRPLRRPVQNERSEAGGRFHGGMVNCKTSADCRIKPFIMRTKPNSMRIGMSTKRLDAPLSGHFGAANVNRGRVFVLN